MTKEQLLNLVGIVYDFVNESNGACACENVETPNPMVCVTVPEPTNAFVTPVTPKPTVPKPVEAAPVEQIVDVKKNIETQGITVTKEVQKNLTVKRKANKVPRPDKPVPVVPVTHVTESVDATELRQAAPVLKMEAPAPTPAPAPKPVNASPVMQPVFNVPTPKPAPAPQPEIAVEEEPVNVPDIDMSDIPDWLK